MLKKAGESTGLEFNSPAHGNPYRSMSVQITVCGESF